ncbi:MAG TPA: YggT family protein [Burkholderiaceae bacterium]|nr:YggT family protein [Burkholderiaceae bacterium]
MFGDTFGFLIKTLFSLFGIALIIRAWMYAIRLHPFNPYSQAVLRITNWLVQPLRHVCPQSHRFDWPSIVGCWLTALVFLSLTWLLGFGMAPSLSVLPGLALAAVLTVLKWTFNLILWATLIQAVLSWVNPMAPVMAVLHTLTAPLLDPIRRMLPNTGGLDFSPLVLLIIAQIAMIMLGHAVYAAFGL